MSNPVPAAETVPSIDPLPEVAPTEAEVRAMDLEAQEAEAREEGPEEAEGDESPIGVVPRRPLAATQRPPADYKRRS